MHRSQKISYYTMWCEVSMPLRTNFEWQIIDDWTVVVIDLLGEKVTIYSAIQRWFTSALFRSNSFLGRALATWVSTFQSAALCVWNRGVLWSMFHCSYTFQLCCFSLTDVTQFIDFGVSYDYHLSFLSHIKRIINKAAGRAKYIFKCFVTRIVFYFHGQFLHLLGLF